MRYRQIFNSNCVEDRVLTDTKLRKIKPTGRAIKLTDEKGLYVYVTPSGGVSFRYDYRLNGKRETLTLGRYPDLSLGHAREQLAEARTLVAAGLDSSAGTGRSCVLVSQPD